MKQDTCTPAHNLSAKMTPSLLPFALLLLLSACFVASDAFVAPPLALLVLHCSVPKDDRCRQSKRLQYRHSNSLHYTMVESHELQYLTITEHELLRLD